QHAGEAASAAWVALAIAVRAAIARDHGERARDGDAHVLLAVAVADDGAANGAVLRERLPGEPFAGLRPLERLEPLVGLALPVVVQRGFDAGGARGVGIRLGRHILAAGARGGHGVEHLPDPRAGRAVDVHDVQRRAGLGRRLDGADDAAQRAARVDVRGCAVARGHAQDLDDLVPGGGGRVGGAEPDRDGALPQPAVDPAHDLRDLFGRGRLVRAGAAGQELARVAEHRHADGDVADGGAVIDELPTLALAVPGVHVPDADLQLEPGRHAVQNRVAVVLLVLAVAVEIDEPGRDDEAGGVNDPC